MPPFGRGSDGFCLLRRILFLGKKKRIVDGVFLAGRGGVILGGGQELCRREGISPNLYYNWSKEFLEAGKRRLMGNTKRQADSDEVQHLRRENGQLKHLVADLSLENVVLKKIDGGSGSGFDEQ